MSDAQIFWTATGTMLESGRLDGGPDHQEREAFKMANKTLPTQAELRRVLDYDPGTGRLKWMITSQGARLGGLAGHLNSRDGHRRVYACGHMVLASRLIWCWVTGEWPPAEVQVDHKDCDPGNDRWANLRLATGSQNGANKRREAKNKSGYKGVSWHAGGKKWQAHIQVRGDNRYLGLFNTREEAHAAYCKAARDCFGEFARVE